MSDIAVDKAKELLPDILSHQERMQKRRAVLNDAITRFEKEWDMDTSKEKLNPREGDPDHKHFSTADLIYQGMSELEDAYDALAARLNVIGNCFLGENKR